MKGTQKEDVFMERERERERGEKAFLVLCSALGGVFYVDRFLEKKVSAQFIDLPIYL